MPTTSDLRPKSTASEAREHDSCTMAEARACGWTPCGSYRARLLPLTLTLSPLREERNGERGRPHVDFRFGSKPAAALQARRRRMFLCKRPLNFHNDCMPSDKNERMGSQLVRYFERAAIAAFPKFGAGPLC